MAQLSAGLRKYYRFISGLKKFHGSRLHPEEALGLARTVIAKRVAAREANFLSLVEKGIFQTRSNPYLKLLETRKITFQDLKTCVSKEGLEGSLNILEREGVYFSVDEFKGRVPVKRNGVEFRCEPSMFDNPFLSYVYEVQSGATRSAGTRVRIDFDYLHQRSLYDALLLDIHGCLTAPVANWFPVFPGAPGINSSLRFAHIGNPVRRWFSQVDESRLNVSWERKLGVRMVYALSRMFGSPLAEAEYVGLNDAAKVARWAAQTLDQHGQCAIYTFAASAVRVCVAAAEANVSLKGVKFLVTGEPLTPHKAKEIESTGAVAVPVYGISEAGVIAAGCNHPHGQSDHCHLYSDTTAITFHKSKVAHSDTTVDSYLFTSILFESPKLLLNVGMGDFGDIYTRPCDCGFGKVGFNTHISTIRSYEKLTGEGVTFVDTDFIWIIEKELPATFGGKSTDYQLVEREDSKGLPRLDLLVSPSVGAIDETEVASTFIRLLKRAEDKGWAQSGTEMWKQSQMVRTVREFPLPTASGKILPFQLMKSQKQAAKTLSNRKESNHGFSSNAHAPVEAEPHFSATRS